MAPPVTPYIVSSELSPEEQEEEYVHKVYDQIAPHFSQTRYKVRFNIVITSLTQSFQPSQ